MRQKDGKESEEAERIEVGEKNLPLGSPLQPQSLGHRALTPFLDSKLLRAQPWKTLLQSGPVNHFVRQVGEWASRSILLMTNHLARDRRQAFVRILGLLCALRLMAGCSAPPPETRTELSTATPQGTPAVPSGTSEDEGGLLYFDQNVQWYIPKTWKGQDRWLTPEGILVKYWVVSRGEKKLEPTEVARLFQLTCEMTDLKFAQAPSPVAQDDFRLWMLGGTGQKKNATHRVEPVVWQACLVEPLHPVRLSGHKIFTSIAPPGSEASAAEALLKVTRTMQRSHNGASPPRIKLLRAE